MKPVLFRDRVRVRGWGLTGDETITVYSSVGSVRGVEGVEYELFERVRLPLDGYEDVELDIVAISSWLAGRVNILYSYFMRCIHRTC